jgi:hypothetical protein
MLGPALRDKHAEREPTAPDGVESARIQVLNHEIGVYVVWELWTKRSVDVERMLVSQSRAKHGTRRFGERCLTQRLRNAELSRLPLLLDGFA